jgi:hypothetical protein
LVERGFAAVPESEEALLVDLLGYLGVGLLLPDGFGGADSLGQSCVEIGRDRLAGDPLQSVGLKGRQRVDFGLLRAVQLKPLGRATLALLQGRRRQIESAHLLGAERRMAVWGLVQRVTEGRASPHGFRSTFRDWCGDNGKPREHAERALAHKFGSAVEAAYARSALLEQRRPLMQAWADYACGDTAGADNVVAMRQARP